jgi:hypothetical protein
MWGSVIARRENTFGSVRRGDDGLMEELGRGVVLLILDVRLGVRLWIERLTGKFEWLAPGSVEV